MIRFYYGFLSFCILAGLGQAIEPAAHYGKIARIVADGVPRIHLSHQKLDDSVSEKALNTYLNSLDFDHSYFLASDVEGFREQAAQLDDDLMRGHLEFAYTVFETFLERMADRTAFVDTLLEQGFDLNKKEGFEWKRKEAPWPDGKEAWDELWRKKIKNDFVARLANKTIIQEKAEAEEAVDAAEAEKTEDVADAGEAEEVEKLSAWEEADEEVLKMTPEEHIQKRFEQFVTVVEGHDEEWVLQLYLNAFTSSYDAHSSYFAPRAAEDFDITMKLSLKGIGALLKTEDGAAEIIRLIKGGPAEHDGRLQPGDKIIAVAQEGEETEDIMYLPLYKAVRLIRGEVGTKVILSVIPASDVSGTTVQKIDLIRDEIKLEEQAAKARLRELPIEGSDETYRLGVIDLPEFYADMSGPEGRSCARDVKQLVEELKTQEVKGILIDLRNNGGGSLPDAVEMAGFFIDEGPVVQVKANRRVKPLDDPKPGVVYDGPMVVLVNRHSASASEIVAAALQDYGRAIVVGDSKTHGKGTVQSLFPLDRNNNGLGKLKLTTAGFYRINGLSTQLKGVEPDIVISSALDAMEIGEEFLPNVMDWSWVARANYEQLSNVRTHIPQLKENSDNRLADDPTYSVLKGLVERLEERTNMKTLPLGFDARLAMARNDRELADLQREHFVGDSDDEDSEEEKTAKRDEKDFILNESLQILKDLAEFQKVANAS